MTSPTPIPNLKLSPRSHQSLKNPEALVSPSVSASRTPSLVRRNSSFSAHGGLGSNNSSFDNIPASRSFSRRNSSTAVMSDKRGDLASDGRNSLGLAGVDVSSRKRNNSTDLPVLERSSSSVALLPSSSSSSCSSGCPSPERSLPATNAAKENNNNNIQQQLAQQQGKGQQQQQQRQQKVHHKKQPLLLQRPFSSSQQQWQTNKNYQQRVVRPAPRGLAAAAATAAARAAERQGLPAATAAESLAGAGGGDIVAGSSVVGADRAAGARAMRGALEGLRGERDSLANACGKLEVEREAAAVRLREGAERARELEMAKRTLEQEKVELARRCRELEKDVGACGRGVCEGAGAAEKRSSELKAAVSKLEKERDENVSLVRACSCYFSCS